MMQAPNCMSCGNITVQKQINGQNGPFTVYECHSGCLKPGTNYKLTTKPPKAPRQQVYQQVPQTQPGFQQTQPANENTGLLKQILSELQSIRQMVNGKTALKNDPLEVVADEGFANDKTPF